MSNIESIKSNLRPFIGTKKIKATPMTWGQYCELRGIPVTQDGNPTLTPQTLGYLIDVFEKTYKKCETFKDRLKIEIQELEERIEKAQAFYHRPYIADITDCEDRMLLAMQLSYMQGYLGTLKLRMKKIEMVANATGTL